MAVAVGVIGTGMIGQDHIRRLTHVLSGARVAALTDVNLERARSLADEGVTVHESGQALIDDPGVDAVVVTSWRPTHEEYVLACLAAGKQVFCEKPLATTREACDRVVDAEVAVGRRPVSVGFMRRFDPQYRAMKAVVAGGEIGAPLMMCALGHGARELARAVRGSLQRRAAGMDRRHGGGRHSRPVGVGRLRGHVVCDTGLAALRSGAREPVVLREKPDLYKELAP